MGVVEKLRYVVLLPDALRYFTLYLLITSNAPRSFRKRAPLDNELNLGAIIYSYWRGAVLSAQANPSTNGSSRTPQHLSLRSFLSSRCTQIDTYPALYPSRRATS